MTVKSRLPFHTAAEWDQSLDRAMKCVCPAEPTKRGLWQCPQPLSCPSLPSWQPQNKQSGNLSLFVPLLMCRAGGRHRKESFSDSSLQPGWHGEFQATCPRCPAPPAQQPAAEGRGLPASQPGLAPPCPCSGLNVGPGTRETCVQVQLFSL